MADTLTIEKLKKAIEVLNENEVPDEAVLPSFHCKTQEEINKSITNNVLDLFGVSHG